MQNWLRQQKYPRDFLEFVYEYYAKHGVAYICTYYHLDIPNSDLDKTELEAGSYEIIGDLSGLKWEKITLLPIYNTESIQPSFMADERGVGKFDQTTSFDVPSTYGITPTFTDFVLFDEIILNDGGVSTDTSPIYRVSNIEKATNTQISFWKMTLNISQFTKTQLDSQTRETYSFVDYEKQIYQIDDATEMYTLLSKNNSLDLKSRFKDSLGLYVFE